MPGFIEMMTSHPLVFVGMKMHSYEPFEMTASKSASFASTIEEIVETGKWAQKAAMVKLGAELRAGRADVALSVAVPCCCACAVAGRRTRDAAQLLAARSAPANHRARARCRIEVVTSRCDSPALEMLIIAAPCLRLPGV
jgi:hypothetical protein